MDIYEEGKKRLAKWFEWRNSDQYKAMSHSIISECEALIDLGKTMIQHASLLLQTASNSESNKTFCTGSSLHRGFYCPSPIYDIIIGNAKRGKLRNKIVSRNKNFYQYFFDSTGELLVVDHVVDGEIIEKELMLYEENIRYGITVDSSNQLVSISKESFHNNTLMEYALLNVISIDCNSLIYLYHKETYSFDTDGLVSCVWNEFDSAVDVLQSITYHFKREDGMLTEYSCVNQPQFDEQYSNPTYLISETKRINSMTPFLK